MPDTSKYVAHFVNRERQHKGFQKMLGGETRKRIMVVVAPEGMGKTWLIQRMRHECSVQTVPVARYNFRSSGGRDTLKIVRKAREELGATHYNPLTQVINDITSGPNVELTIESVEINISESTLIDSSITVDDESATIAEAVRDNYQEVHTSDAQVRAMQNARINDAFFECLAKQSEVQPVVFLFDGYEDAQTEERHWIEEELLRRVRDSLLPQVIVVLTSRNEPGFSEDWEDAIAETGLSGFEERHVREYIERRDALAILEKHKNFIQIVLDVRANNDPKMLANMVDGYIESSREEEDDDWLL